MKQYIFQLFFCIIILIAYSLNILGIEPIVWKQAKLDNPDPERLIPVPLIGFQELSRRMKTQEYETKQHQKRLDVIMFISLLMCGFSLKYMF